MSCRLSKTKILHGLHCPKRLWLEVHQPELAHYSERAAQIIQAGHEANKAYRELIPEGILVEHVNDLKAALNQTQVVLKEFPGTPVFEGTFQHKGVMVRADYLYLRSKKFHLVEVKARTSFDERHIRDCAIQTSIIEAAGIPIKTIELALIDTSFVNPGTGNYSGLFTHVNVTESVRPLIKHVPVWIQQCHEILKSGMPMMKIENHCYDPYECPFLNYCFVPGPDYPVECLPYGGNIAKELIAERIFDIREIPEDRLSNSTHERVRRITTNGKAEINPAVVSLMKKFPYPRYYLDFETVAFAVPRWRGTRPYRPIPFQWSCHIEHADGEIDHRWFLNTSGEAPMRAVADSLVKNLGTSGPVFMYTPFEKTRITDLMGFVPDLAPKLKGIIARLVDLKPIVKDHYYHPDMKGSWSLKPVIACIAPEMSYAKLEEVNDGMAAQRAYLEIIATETNDIRRENLKKKLLDYCKLDTLAMVRITRIFQGI